MAWKTRRILQLRPIIYGLFLLGVSSCATVPRERAFNDFIIVRVGPGEDFSSLAAEYLHDASKSWQIAELNPVDSLRPGREVIIPLTPLNPRGLSVGGYQTVPILTYYGFSRKTSGELIVLESDFRNQMRYLKENGYLVIPLNQFLVFLDSKDPIPEKSVMITFDDGRRSLYDIAFPILREYGFPATLFVYTDFIGAGKALSWQQIDELSHNGFEVQSKTVTHRNLVKREPHESFEEYFRSVQKEVSQSKRTIEKKLKKECSTMAYPYGESNALIVALLKKEGYRGAFTVKGGTNPFFVNNYSINRSIIRGGLDMNQFKACLSVFAESELK